MSKWSMALMLLATLVGSVSIWLAQGAVAGLSVLGFLLFCVVAVYEIDDHLRHWDD